ncbi:hypothetical protein GCM10010376_85310 [Streptomyces violaceusniger]
MDAGQVAVEDHHVVAGDGKMFEGGSSVQDDVDGHALMAQPVSDGAGEDLEVLDDEDPHRPSPPVVVRAGRPNRPPGRGGMRQRCQIPGLSRVAAAATRLEPGAAYNRRHEFET